MKKGKLLFISVAWFVLITFTTTTIAWSSPSSFAVQKTEGRSEKTEDRYAMADGQKTEDRSEKVEGTNLSSNVSPLSSRSPLAWQIQIPKELGDVKARWVSPRNNSPLSKGVPDKAGDVKDNVNNNEIVHNPLAPFNKGDDQYPRSSANHDRTVVILQDAHCNYEAQTNIAKIIALLGAQMKIAHNPAGSPDGEAAPFNKGEAQSPLTKGVPKAGVVTVALEGAVGPLDVEPYRSYEDKDIRDAVLDYFVRSGKISGAEFAAITDETGAQFVGVEDPELYLENYEAFLSIVKYRGPLEAEVEAIEAVLAELRTILYSPELQAFEESFLAFREERIDFFQYADILLSQAKKLEIDLLEYPNVALYREVKEREARINFEKLEEEVPRFLGTLEAALAKTNSNVGEPREAPATIGTVPGGSQPAPTYNDGSAKLRRFIQQFQSGMVSRNEFFTYIVEQGFKNKINLLAYTNLYEYSQYLKSYQRIDKSSLRFERRALERKIKEELINFSQKGEGRREKGEKETVSSNFYPLTSTLLDLSERLQFIRNLIHVKVFNQDADEFEKERTSFHAKDYVDFIQKVAPQYSIPYTVSINSAYLDLIIPKVYDFYAASKKRDVSMVDHLLQQMGEGRREKGEDGNNLTPTLAVLVAGGFHTRGICDILEDRGISYVVISPTITQKQDDQEKIYTSRMLGEPDALDVFVADLLNKQIVPSSMYQQSNTFASAQVQHLQNPSLLALRGFLNSLMVDNANPLRQALESAPDLKEEFLLLAGLNRAMMAFINTSGRESFQAALQTVTKGKYSIDEVKDIGEQDTVVFDINNSKDNIEQMIFDLEWMLRNLNLHKTSTIKIVTDGNEPVYWTVRKHEVTVQNATADLQELQATGTDGASFTSGAQDLTLDEMAVINTIYKSIYEPIRSCVTQIQVTSVQALNGTKLEIDGSVYTIRTADSSKAQIASVSGNTIYVNANIVEHLLNTFDSAEENKLALRIILAHELTEALSIKRQVSLSDHARHLLSIFIEQDIAESVEGAVYAEIARYSEMVGVIEDVFAFERTQSLASFTSDANSSAAKNLALQNYIDTLIQRTIQESYTEFEEAFTFAQKKLDARFVQGGVAENISLQGPYRAILTSLMADHYLGERIRTYLSKSQTGQQLEQALLLMLKEVVFQTSERNLSAETKRLCIQLLTTMITHGNQEEQVFDLIKSLVRNDNARFTDQLYLREIGLELLWSVFESLSVENKMYAIETFIPSIEFDTVQLFSDITGVSDDMANLRSISYNEHKQVVTSVIEKIRARMNEFAVLKSTDAEVEIRRIFTSMTTFSGARKNIPEFLLSVLETPNATEMKDHIAVCLETLTSYSKSLTDKKSQGERELFLIVKTLTEQLEKVLQDKKSEYESYKEAVLRIKERMRDAEALGRQPGMQEASAVSVSRLRAEYQKVTRDMLAAIENEIVPEIDKMSQAIVKLQKEVDVAYAVVSEINARYQENKVEQKANNAFAELRQQYSIVEVPTLKRYLIMHGDKGLTEIIQQFNAPAASDSISVTIQNETHFVTRKDLVSADMASQWQNYLRTVDMDTLNRVVLPFAVGQAAVINNETVRWIFFEEIFARGNLESIAKIESIAETMYGKDALENAEQLVLENKLHDITNEGVKRYFLLRKNVWRNAAYVASRIKQYEDLALKETKDDAESVAFEKVKKELVAYGYGDAYSSEKNAEVVLDIINDVFSDAFDFDKSNRETGFRSFDTQWKQADPKREMMLSFWKNIIQQGSGTVQELTDFYESFYQDPQRAQQALEDVKQALNIENNAIDFTLSLRDGRLETELSSIIQQDVKQTESFQFYDFMKVILTENKDLADNAHIWESLGIENSREIISALTPYLIDGLYEGVTLSQDSAVIKESLSQQKTKSDEEYARAYARYKQRMDLLLSIRELLKTNKTITPLELESTIKRWEKALSEGRFNEEGLYHHTLDSEIACFSLFFNRMSGMSLREAQKALCYAFERNEFGLVAMAGGKSIAFLLHQGSFLRRNRQRAELEDTTAPLYVVETTAALDKFIAGSTNFGMKHAWITSFLGYELVNMTKIFEERNWDALEKALDKTNAVYIIEPGQKGFSSLSLMEFSHTNPRLFDKFRAKISSFHIDEADRYLSLTMQYITSIPTGEFNFSTEDYDAVLKIKADLERMENENPSFIIDQGQRSEEEFNALKRKNASGLHLYVNRDVHGRPTVSVSQELEDYLKKTYAEDTANGLKMSNIHSIVQATAYVCGYDAQGQYTIKGGKTTTTGGNYGDSLSDAEFSDKYLLAVLYEKGKQYFADQYFEIGSEIAIDEFGGVKRDDSGDIQLVKRGRGKGELLLIKQRIEELENKKEMTAEDQAELQSLKTTYRSLVERIVRDYPNSNNLLRSLTTQRATGHANISEAEVFNRKKAVQWTFDENKKILIDSQGKELTSIIVNLTGEGDVAQSKVKVSVETQEASGETIFRVENARMQGTISLKDVVGGNEREVFPGVALKLFVENGTTVLSVRRRVLTPMASGTLNPLNEAYCGTKTSSLSPSEANVQGVRNVHFSQESIRNEIVRILDSLREGKMDLSQKYLNKLMSVIDVDDITRYADDLVKLYEELTFTFGLPGVIMDENKEVRDAFVMAALNTGKYQMYTFGDQIQDVHLIQKEIGTISGDVDRILTEFKEETEGGKRLANKRIKEYQSSLKALMQKMAAHTHMQHALVWDKVKDRYAIEGTKQYRYTDFVQDFRNNEFQDIVQDMNKSYSDKEATVDGASVTQELIQAFLKELGAIQSAASTSAKELVDISIEIEKQRISALRSHKGKPYLFQITTNTPHDLVNTLAAELSKIGFPPGILVAPNVEVVKQGVDFQTRMIKDALLLNDGNPMSMKDALLGSRDTQRSYIYNTGNTVYGRPQYGLIQYNTQLKKWEAVTLGVGAHVVQNGTAGEVLFQLPYFLLVNGERRNANTLQQQTARVAREEGSIGITLTVARRGVIANNIAKIKENEEVASSIVRGLQYGTKDFKQGLLNALGNGLSSAEYAHFTQDNLFEYLENCIIKLRAVGSDHMTASELLFLNAAYYTAHQLISGPLEHRIEEVLSGMLHDELYKHAHFDVAGNPYNPVDKKDEKTKEKEKKKNTVQQIVYACYVQSQNPESQDNVKLTDTELRILGGGDRLKGSFLSMIDRYIREMEKTIWSLERGLSWSGAKFDSKESGYTGKNVLTVKIRNAQEKEEAKRLMSELRKNIDQFTNYKKEVEGWYANVEKIESSVEQEDIPPLYMISDMKDLMKMWRYRQLLVADYQAGREQKKPYETMAAVRKDVVRDVVQEYYNEKDNKGVEDIHAEKQMLEKIVSVNAPLFEIVRHVVGEEKDAASIERIVAAFLQEKSDIDTICETHAITGSNKDLIRAIVTRMKKLDAIMSKPGMVDPFTNRLTDRGNAIYSAYRSMMKSVMPLPGAPLPPDDSIENRASIQSLCAMILPTSQQDDTIDGTTLLRVAEEMILNKDFTMIGYVNPARDSAWLLYAVRSLRKTVAQEALQTEIQKLYETVPLYDASERATSAFQSAVANAMVATGGNNASPTLKKLARSLARQQDQRMKWAEKNEKAQRDIAFRMANNYRGIQWYKVLFQVPYVVNEIKQKVVTAIGKEKRFLVQPTWRKLQTVGSTENPESGLALYAIQNGMSMDEFRKIRSFMTDYGVSVPRLQNMKVKEIQKVVDAFLKEKAQARSLMGRSEKDIVSILAQEARKERMDKRRKIASTVLSSVPSALVLIFFGITPGLPLAVAGVWSMFISYVLTGTSPMTKMSDGVKKLFVKKNIQKNMFTVPEISIRQFTPLHVMSTLVPLSMIQRARLLEKSYELAGQLMNPELRTVLLLLQADMHNKAKSLSRDECATIDAILQKIVDLQKEETSALKDKQPFDKENNATLNDILKKYDERLVDYRMLIDSQKGKTVDDMTVQEIDAIRNEYPALQLPEIVEILDGDKHTKKVQEKMGQEIETVLTWYSGVSQISYKKQIGALLISAAIRVERANAAILKGESTVSEVQEQYGLSNEELRIVQLLHGEEDILDKRQKGRQIRNEDKAKRKQERIEAQAEKARITTEKKDARRQAQDEHYAAFEAWAGSIISTPNLSNMERKGQFDDLIGQVREAGSNSMIRAEQVQKLSLLIEVFRSWVVVTDDEIKTYQELLEVLSGKNEKNGLIRNGVGSFSDAYAMTAHFDLSLLQPAFRMDPQLVRSYFQGLAKALEALKAQRVTVGITLENRAVAEDIARLAEEELSGFIGPVNDSISIVMTSKDNQALLSQYAEAVPCLLTSEAFVPVSEGGIIHVLTLDVLFIRLAHYIAKEDEGYWKHLMETNVDAFDFSSPICLAVSEDVTNAFKDKTFELAA